MGMTMSFLVGTLGSAEADAELDEDEALEEELDLAPLLLLALLVVLVLVVEDSVVEDVVSASSPSLIGCCSFLPKPKRFLTPSIKPSFSGSSDSHSTVTLVTPTSPFSLFRRTPTL